MTRYDTRRLTVLSLLSALIVALGIVCSFVRFGPVQITLALTPIIIGAALYGVGAGALLGFVFGLVTLVTGLLGWDGGFVLLLMGYGDSIWFAIATVLLCFGKAILAGYVGALVYRLLEGKSRLGAVIGAGIVTPVVNTGVFALGMLTAFRTLLGELAGGADAVKFLFLTMIGVNFLVELGVNLVLAAVIARVIELGSKMGARR